MKGVADFGAGDVMEVVLEDGKILVLPFTKEAVPLIDPANHRLVVDPPQGLEVTEADSNSHRMKATIARGVK